MLLLRTADKDRRSYGGFQYPEFGPVEAKDWSAAAHCGNGLHGLRDGVGDASLLRSAEDAVWQVLEAPVDGPCVDLEGKVKVPKAVVVYSGDRLGAIAYLDANGCADKPVVWAARQSGHSGTATAGDSGTATAGDSGTATAGYSGTATAGHSGTATAGDSGTATAGDSGTATAGYSGTATAGDSGTATAGYSGTATAGDSGTATAGYRGTATAGDEGVLIITRWDSKAGKYRRSMALVGENDILPNVAYRLDDDGVFVRVEVPAAVAS